MDILGQLSSQLGDRTGESNRVVVAICLASPSLLAEIAEGLTSGDAALTGDCAEVLTMIAVDHPDWVASFATALAALLSHRTARVRWEAMHALDLVAGTTPTVVASLLPRLAEIIRRDSSVIVRDYAVEAVGRYAETSEPAARAACPVLFEALAVFDGRQRARALVGLVSCALAASDLAPELRAIGSRYVDDERSSVRKAAKALIRATRTTSSEPADD